MDHPPTLPSVHHNPLAQAPEQNASGTSIKSMRIELAHTAPKIDGVIDDAVWTTALWREDFEEAQPKWGAKPAFATHVAIAIDDDALYVAARMDDDHPERIYRAMTRHDDTRGAERFIISLDPARTGRTAYSFAVTAAGVRADWIHTDDSPGHRDLSWDPVWQAAVRLTATGWVAEMRIPLAQLNYPSSENPVWGVNFNRFVPKRHEDLFWIAVPLDRTAWASAFGELRGLPALKRRIHVELLPYVSASVLLNEAPGSAPFASVAKPDASAGLDAKIGLTSALTLDATINPDFGQVQVDPQVVNLTAYQIVFPELRPFFISGTELFTNAGEDFFNSRRIGALPAITVPTKTAADVINTPSQADIIGAAKLSGTIVPGVRIGALAALTGAVTADAIIGGDAKTVTLAPLTGWGALRVEHSLGANGSLWGINLTGVHRDINDANLSAQLASTAVTGGSNMDLRFNDGEWNISASAGGSALAGAPAAITAIEASPTHYFQRPDQAHVHLDSDATSLLGWQAAAEAERRAGTLQGYVATSVESPGFDLNDIGLLQSADHINAAAGLSYNQLSASPWWHDWEAGLDTSTSWNFGGVAKPIVLAPSAGFTTTSFAGGNINAQLRLPGMSDNLTRGGPLMATDWGGHLGIAIHGATGYPTQWRLGVSGDLGESEPSAANVNGSLTLRPTPRLRFDIGPSLSLVHDPRQYVTTLADPSAGNDTFGSRYIFATIDRREASMELRARVAFTPDLTFELYAQPFVSTGQYSAIGQLAAPRTHDLRIYSDIQRVAGTAYVTDGGEAFSFTDPDFTVVSLRSTAVLRWEFAPGSVLYAVWQQNRAQDRAGASTWSPGLFGQTVTSNGEHTIALKLTYWWSS